MTIYKAQGVTVDRADLLGDGLNAESGHTALTRGRNQNHLYTPVGHHQPVVPALVDEGSTSLRAFGGAADPTG